MLSTVLNPRSAATPAPAPSPAPAPASAPMTGPTPPAATTKAPMKPDTGRGDVAMSAGALAVFALAALVALHLAYRDLLL